MEKSSAQATGPIEELSPSDETPYWVFVSNPKKWKIDQFLEREIKHDSWSVRPPDRERFAPGQLGVVRVGVDRRTVTERNGRPRMKPGIYALCEVESEVFSGTGDRDEFSGRGWKPKPGRPMVKICYLQNYLTNPLTIERLRREKPHISKLLLNGFQASSFPIPAADFREVLALLGGEPDHLPSETQRPEVTAETLVALEQKYLRASPEVKERLSRDIERGPVGTALKRATGFKCQACEALSLNPLGFIKPDGERYVEAHHVMPVSKMEIGSLAASNIMIVCANHHRQMHYGRVQRVIGASTFDFLIDGKELRIARLGLSK